MRKKLLAIALFVIMIISIMSLTACGNNKMEQATITSKWPDNEFVAAVPKLEAGKLFSYTTYVKHDRMMFIVQDVTREEFDAYRKDMVNMGYRETSLEEDSETSSVTAEYSKDGWKVSLFYGANITMRVYKK